MEKEKLTKAQASARNMVGDNKLPNKYWVSACCEWLTNKPNRDDKENANCYEGSSEAYSDLSEGKSEIHGGFPTFAEAMEKFNELMEQCHSPEDDIKGEEYHMVTMEDRLSGTIYEYSWRETWKMKEYRGEQILAVSFHDETTDDTRYTREEMERRGATFE